MNYEDQQLNNRHLFQFNSAGPATAGAEEIAPKVRDRQGKVGGERENRGSEGS